MKKQRLQPCFCGRIPKRLCISEGHSCKYSFASGDCCGEWMIEFRTEYRRDDDPKLLELAAKAWNAAPRGEDLQV
jgi:hypothetical protein